MSRRKYHNDWRRSDRFITRELWTDRVHQVGSQRYRSDAVARVNLFPPMLDPRGGVGRECKSLASGPLWPRYRSSRLFHGDCSLPRPIPGSLWTCLDCYVTILSLLGGIVNPLLLRVGRVQSVHNLVAINRSGLYQCGESLDREQPSALSGEEV